MVPGSQPKHVSNPDAVIQKFKPHLILTCFVFPRPPPPVRRNKSRARKTGETREDDVGDQQEILPYANASHSHIT